MRRPELGRRSIVAEWSIASRTQDGRHVQQSTPYWKSSKNTPGGLPRTWVGCSVGTRCSSLTFLTSEGCRDPSFLRPSSGSRKNLEAIEEWVVAAFEYWRNEDRACSVMGASRIAVFRSIFARSFEVRPPLSRTLATGRSRADSPHRRSKPEFSICFNPGAAWRSAVVLEPARLFLQ